MVSFRLYGDFCTINEKKPKWIKRKIKILPESLFLKKKLFSSLRFVPWIMYVWCFDINIYLAILLMFEMIDSKWVVRTHYTFFFNLTNCILQFILQVYIYFRPNNVLYMLINSSSSTNKHVSNGKKNIHTQHDRHKKSTRGTTTTKLYSIFIFYDQLNYRHRWIEFQDKRTRRI